MSKLLGVVLLVSGLFLVPFGIGIPMMLFGCRELNKSSDDKS